VCVCVCVYTHTLTHKSLATGWEVRGSKSGGGARFSGNNITGPEAHPASCSTGKGSLSRGKKTRGLALTTCPLYDRGKNGYSYPLLPVWVCPLCKGKALYLLCVIHTYMYTHTHTHTHIYIYMYTRVHKISPPLHPALFLSWTLGEVKTFPDRSFVTSEREKQQMFYAGLHEPQAETCAKRRASSSTDIRKILLLQLCSELASRETAVLWSASHTMQPINSSSIIPVFSIVNISVWQYLSYSPSISHPRHEVLITAILRHSHLLVAFPEVYLLILQC